MYWCLFMHAAIYLDPEQYVLLSQENIDEIAMLETLDNGKPFKYSRTSDLPQVSSASFRHIAWDVWCATHARTHAFSIRMSRLLSLRAASWIGTDSVV